MLIAVAVLVDTNVIKREAEKIIRKLSRHHNRNSAHVERASKSDTGNNMGYWNCFSITQRVPEQHPGKARN